jgi:glycogen operon protein
MAEAPHLPSSSPRITPEGTRFRVLSRAKRIRLQLYDEAAADRPAREITLDRRDGDVWEILVPGIGAGQHYTWAVEDRPLLDPYALALSGPERFGADDPERIRSPRPPRAARNSDATFKSVVVAPPPAADWQRPGTPLSRSLVYELHVRGFTRHESSGVAHPGTYRGLAEKIPYLRELGVTAVELLPVFEFDETETRPDSLVNFWGYSPISFFAPNRRYAAAAHAPDGPILEFREMVRRFHEAGIQVLLDVVFNHTAEMGAAGTTWNLRGLDEDAYYLDGVDWTGCGNTIRAESPAVQEIVLAALRWWVHGLGVDGFRFDLATVLARDGSGAPLEHPPLIRAVENDPALAGVHLIAEPWDAGGGYAVGSWPGAPRWSEWNDRFRDDVRRAWLLGATNPGTLAKRLSGSGDLFRAPMRSLNFVSAHDGFTLADMVSYAERHNEANGQDGNDGHALEVSAHHGVEGPSEDAGIRSRRDRARRNLLASLLLSQGVPMLLSGDELGRTQRGNNNAYCHDSDLSWVDWGGFERDAAFRRFAQGLIETRAQSRLFDRSTFWSEDEVTWLGPKGGAPRWEKQAAPFGLQIHAGLLLLVNPGERRVVFRLPGPAAWRLVADTAAPPPADFHEPGSEPSIERVFDLADRSLALFRTAG